MTLDTVAVKTNFSRSYVSRLFRKNTGCSFCEYLTAYRLDKACVMLRSTDDSVLGIALACGFSNVSYFIQMFRKNYGITPLKYRNSYK